MFVMLRRPDSRKPLQRAIIAYRKIIAKPDLALFPLQSCRKITNFATIIQIFL